MRLLLVIILSLIATIYSLTDRITSWTLGSNTMPFKNRCQAIGYDQYTGIIHLLGGACPTCHTHYVTYNTLTNTMSALQSIPNSGRGSDQPYAQYYIQINRILYIYNFENQCIDTFDMSTTTFTSRWSSIGTLIPTNSLKACMAIDDSARYFYLIPETNAFFFYDKIQQTWYSGPNTFQSIHLFSGCDVVDNKLYFWGGQAAWGQGGADLLTLEYLDISDMNALKTNPSSFSWNIQYNFLPFAHDFVRTVRLNDGNVYSVGGYRFSGDGQNIEVFAIDLSINQLQRSIDIPTKAIGGSLVWDSCQRKFYYFGGYDGSSDQDTFWYSNTISTADVPSKYQMDCNPTTATPTTTTPTTVRPTTSAPTTAIPTTSVPTTAITTTSTQTAASTSESTVSTTSTTLTTAPTTTLYYPKNTVTEGSIQCGTITEGYTTYPTEIANYTLTVYNQCKEESTMRLHIDLCNTQFNNPFIYLWKVETSKWSRVQKSNALMDCKHGDYENMVSINWYLHDGEYILGIGSIAHVSSRSIPYEFGHYFMNITCKMLGCGAQETTTVVPSVTEDMQNGSDSNDVIIIGGSISGFVILLLLTIFLVYYFCFKNRNSKNESFLQETKINVTECIKNSDQIVNYELPINWEAIQTKNGRVFYYNNITKHSQWDRPIIIESNANKIEMVVQQVVIPVETNENKSSDNMPGTIINTNTVQVELNEKSDKINCEGDMEGNNENEIKNETHMEPGRVADAEKKEMPGTIGNGNVNKIENNDQVFMHQDVYNLLVNDVHIGNNMKMKYFNLLIENGFDTLNSIKTLTNQDLIDIGIDKLGHRKMILSVSEQL